MTAERLYELMRLYLEGNITHTDLRELDSLLERPDLKALLKEDILKQLHNSKYFVEVDLSEFHKKLEDKLRLSTTQSGAEQDAFTSYSKISFFRRGLTGNRTRGFNISWQKYAAVFIVLVGAGVFMWYNSRKTAVAVAPALVATKNTDIPPGGNNAILTLSDGTVIMLDKTDNGAIAQQGNTSIIKMDDGQIAYNVKGMLQGRPMMNTMQTPRGGQYKLTLPDGTLVWLDAESSITYPVAFAGKERNVKVTGQAYFEVAKNAECPFFVNVNDRIKVQVIGTHFNVSAVEEDAVIKTTLLEGSIELINGNNVTLVKPGQQAQTNAGSHDIKILNDVNTDEVVAWKDGLFSFINSDIQTIMKQCARWYNVDVSYQGDIPYRFVATISRDVPISKLLKILELTDRVHFKIDGRKITVMP